MGDFFNFTAHTIDGELLDVPKIIPMDCDLVKPLNQTVVRQFDKQMCIVARKVYLVFYAGHVFGSTDFANTTEFMNYRNNECCGLAFGECLLTFEGDNLNFS